MIVNVYFPFLFQAHRSVLASCSDYFLAMFTDPMRERWQTEICLAGVSSASFHIILDWIYTSKLVKPIRGVYGMWKSIKTLTSQFDVSYPIL